MVSGEREHEMITIALSLTHEQGVTVTIEETLQHS